MSNIYNDKDKKRTAGSDRNACYEKLDWPDA